MILQQQYISIDPVALLTHLIHNLNWMVTTYKWKCMKEKYQSRKGDSIRRPKFHLAEMRLNVKSDADTRKMLANITGHGERVCAEQRWHRWLSCDFHCLGQLDLTWQRVMRLSIGLQRNKQSSTPPKSLGREGTAKCNILKNAAWENAAHWFSIDYSIRALM